MYRLIKPEYILTFSYEPKLSKDTGGFNYEYELLRTSDNAIIRKESLVYVPVTRSIETEYDLQEALSDIVRVRVKAKTGLSKNMRVRPAFYKTLRDLRANVLNVNCRPRPQTHIMPIQAEDDDRMYMVVRKDGVWTIERAANKFLNEDEAKALLFKKIVNGED